MNEVRNMKIRKNYFNLIEIVLTVAVISFGVVVILGMLPKGMRASRNAAAVSYASEVIDQIGGYLLKHGAGHVTATSFDDAVSADDATIMKEYTQLVEYAYDPTRDPGGSYKRTGTAGVFRYNDKDAYVVVMGDEQEIDGEKNQRIDFSGLLRICKNSDAKGKFVAIDHDNTPEHKCFADPDHCGSAGIDKSGKGFKVEEKALKGATVYIELSYPLSLPYADRTKRYFSFDVPD